MTADTPCQHFWMEAAPASLGKEICARCGLERPTVARPGEWMALMPERGPLDDDPNWTCCGDPDCPFARKCSDVERMEAAWTEYLHRGRQL